MCSSLTTNLVGSPQRNGLSPLLGIHRSTEIPAKKRMELAGHAYTWRVNDDGIEKETLLWMLECHGRGRQKLEKRSRVRKRGETAGRLQVKEDGGGSSRQMWMVASSLSGL